MAVLTIPNTFVAGTPALASEVNANFSQIVSWSTGLDQDNMATFTGDLAFTIANGNAIVIQNNGNDESIKITQGALLGAGKASIQITDNLTQTALDAAEFKMSLAAGATIPAIHVIHGVSDTLKLTKLNLTVTVDNINLINSSTLLYSNRIKIPVQTTTQRNAIVSPETGSILYDSTADQVSVKRSDGWSPIGIPVGSVQMYATSTAPEGWLLCDGTEYLKTAYPALNTVLSNGGTYPYGQTNGSGGVGTTHFRTPNTKGIFVRGTGSQTIGGLTYTSTLGQKQNDQMQGHQHSFNGGGTGSGGWALGYIAATGSGAYTWTKTDDALVTDGINGTPRIGNENYPANISLNYIIKY